MLAVYARACRSPLHPVSRMAAAPCKLHERRQTSAVLRYCRAIFRFLLGGAGAVLLLEVLVMASMSGGGADAGRGSRGACLAAIFSGSGAIGYAYLLTRVRY